MHSIRIKVPATPDQVQRIQVIAGRNGAPLVEFSTEIVLKSRYRPQLPNAVKGSRVSTEFLQSAGLGESGAD